MSILVTFYTNSVSHCLPEWENILFRFRRSVEDKDVWEQARHSEDIPHLGNVYQSLVLNSLENLFCELSGLTEPWEEVDITCFVNGTDTHFCIDGEAICTEADFFKALAVYTDEAA
ncbi:hypothetical protein [Pasteurella testudinis]|uniref:hypothetical protein n=1 Tax=Pasteurella testudinis TaxID=761 RepID=UPI004058A9A2